jgi:small subunit ribosomal protein S4
MRYTEPKVRLSRRVGASLTPKATRYFERRPYGPGMHGRKKNRSRAGDYEVRLREKQKLRFLYDLSEKQLRRALATAQRHAGRTGDELVADLESRLVSVVYRAGLAPSIYAARQYVSHGHLTVDGKKVDRPSFRVRPGQVVAVADASRSLLPFVIAAEGTYASGPPPTYLEVELPELRARLLHRPPRPAVPVDIDEKLVVEHYSR